MDKTYHFTPEQEAWLIQSYHNVTSYDELTDIFNHTFGLNRTKSSIREKCNKRLGLNGMPNPSKYGQKQKGQLPIGTIRKSQNATYIKVEDVPSGVCFTGYKEPYWIPLQKKIYQDAYGKISQGHMVCFLDRNSDNFDLDNLYCIDRKISAIMSKNGWWNDTRELTLAAIKWCELHYAIKNLNN